MTASYEIEFSEINGGRRARRTLAFTDRDTLARMLAGNTSNTRVKPVPLGELRKAAAMKDALGDAGDATALGVADAAGSPLLGSTSNNTAKTEIAAINFAVPADYVAGSDLTVRIRGKVSAARQVGATVDLVAKLQGDAALGSDICATAAQTLTTSYVNYDFTVTGTTLSPGDLVYLEFKLTSDDTGGSSNGASSATKIEVRYPGLG